jgi:hypothetical protein
VATRTNISLTTFTHFLHSRPFAAHYRFFTSTMAESRSIKISGDRAVSGRNGFAARHDQQNARRRMKKGVLRKGPTRPTTRRANLRITPQSLQSAQTRRLPGSCCGIGAQEEPEIPSDNEISYVATAETKKPQQDSAQSVHPKWIPRPRVCRLHQDLIRRKNPPVHDGEESEIEGDDTTAQPHQNFHRSKLLTRLRQARVAQKPVQEGSDIAMNGASAQSPRVSIQHRLNLTPPPSSM